jgi:hypothetical protein
LEIRLTTPETLELTMKDSRDSWDKLKMGIGKLSLYEMKKYEEAIMYFQTANTISP